MILISSISTTYAGVGFFNRNNLNLDNRKPIFSIFYHIKILFEMHSLKEIYTKNLFYFNIPKYCNGGFQGGSIGKIFNYNYFSTLLMLLELCSAANKSHIFT